MTTIGPNERFHGLLDQSPPGAMRELEERKAEVRRTHLGRDVSEVQAALTAAITAAGAYPDPAGVAEEAREISDMKPEA